MSALIPRRAGGEDPERAHSELQQRPLSQAEYRALWEVRAAQWRARELAEELFGSVGYMALIGIAGKGHPRGLLHMEVPFESLEAHRLIESRFMSAAARDPILTQVPLVYVMGPASE
jgi:hypothetical protein